MRLILSLILSLACAAGACVQVSSDRIVIADLWNAAPALQQLDSATLVGFTPFPGTERVIPGSELIQLARHQGLTLRDVPDVCVERALRLISPDEMRATLLAALGIADAQLEVLEYSSQPLPAGRLQFQRAGLNQPPAGTAAAPVVWRGRLMYDENRSLAVWAKVKITVQRPIFEAAEDIPAGAIVQEAQVHAGTVHEFPFPGPWLDSSSGVIGKLARRRIRAGERFTAAALDEPKDVLRGDLIQVRVLDGSTTLSLDGIAASSGKKGDTILVHNSASGRNFRAVVEGKDKAIVRPTGD